MQVLVGGGHSASNQRIEEESTNMFSTVVVLVLLFNGFEAKPASSTNDVGNQGRDGSKYHIDIDIE